MTEDVKALGAMIEEALDQEDDSELMRVIMSFTPQQWLAIAKALQRKPDA